MISRVASINRTHTTSQASEILAALAEVFSNYSEEERKSQIKKVRDGHVNAARVG